MAQRINQRRTRHKLSFSGTDHLKIPLVPSGDDTDHNVMQENGLEEIAQFQACFGHGVKAPDHNITKFAKLIFQWQCSTVDCTP